MTFVIEPHFRLQEWVAEEKGYFADEGLDHIFQENIRSTDGRQHDPAVLPRASLSDHSSAA